MSSKTPAVELHWHAGVDVPAFCELLHAALDDFTPIAIHEDDAGGAWRVFFKDQASRDRAATALALAFPTEISKIRAEDVADEEWARRSQAHLHAVRVGRVIVAPPWDVPQSADADALVIVIDPSMGFGTGHHQTTRLCLSLLQEIALTDRRAIDVGTGSGILAIAAARLGSTAVIGLDDDADALANAEANVGLNGVRAAVSLVHVDLAEFRSAPAAVVTANLTGAALVRHADALRRLVADRGALIVSGFTVDESAGVVAAIGATIEREVSEGEWAAARLRFPAAER